MSTMAKPARLAHICRHPVKAAGFEELDSIELTAGEPMPLDRRWAVAHAAAPFKGNPEGWERKQAFLRGVASAELMAIRARWDEAAQRLALNHPRAGTITADPESPADAARLVDWLRPLWPEGRPAPDRLVRRASGALADNPEPYVSILNLASNRALGQRLGQALSIHRWRGNLWVDGLAPWEEFDLIGQEIAIGAVRLRMERPITRCLATAANPETGRSDADTLGALEEGYGHQDFGVFAVVASGGRLRIGDPVSLP